MIAPSHKENYFSAHWWAAGAAPRNHDKSQSALCYHFPSQLASLC